MALANLDLTGSYAIHQKYEWRLAIYYPGNVINAALWGQIWSAYEPGKGLAQFTFERATYDPVLNQTKLPVVLTSFTTGNLIPTGNGFYVYEISISLPRRNPQPLLAGKVHVLPSLEFLK
jgi:hypothetical protein